MRNKQVKKNPESKKNVLRKKIRNTTIAFRVLRSITIICVVSCIAFPPTVPILVPIAVAGIASQTFASVSITKLNKKLNKIRQAEKNRIEQNIYDEKNKSSRSSTPEPERKTKYQGIS